VGDLLGEEDLEEGAVAHLLLFGPERQLRVETPDGGQVQTPEHGVQIPGRFARAHEAIS